MRRVWQAVLGTGLLLVVGLALWTPHAAALTPNDIPDILKQNYRNYDSGPYVRPADGRTYPGGCSSIPEKYLTTGWVSKQGAPTVTDFNVPNGTTSIPLQWQINDMVCKDHATLNGAFYSGLPQDGQPRGTSLTELRSTVDVRTIRVSLAGSSVTPGNLGDEQVMSASGSSRYWFTGSNPFVLNLPANAPSKKYTIHIDFMLWGANQFNGGGYTCLVGPTRAGMNSGNYNDPKSPSQCDETPYGFDINITVDCGSGTTGGAGVCTPIQCGALTTTPLNPEPNQVTTLRGTMTYSGGTPPSATNGKIVITGPPNYTYNPVLPAVGGGNVALSTAQTFSQSGTYNVVWSAVINGKQFDCPGSFQVAIKPYFSVIGGDIATGASVATPNGATTNVCGSLSAPTIPTAGIVSWNNDTPPGFGGAGGEYAAYAMNYIQDFATVQGKASGSAWSFSNKNNTSVTPNSVSASGSSPAFFGGMFGSAPCMDYWGGRSAAAGLSSLADVSALANGKYYYNAPAGTLVLPAQTIRAGSQVTIYVSGNVTLTGDITYSGTYTKRTDIPNFKLIVNGVINIDKSVKNLDGFYAAIPNVGYQSITGMNFNSPQAGTIVTCTNGVFPINPLTTNMLATCGNQLTFNGAVAANQIWLLRSYGTLGQANTPAEVFNYTPELWLAPASDTIDTNQDYQSVVGLPPIL